MMVPTLGVVALLAVGLVEDTHALLAIQHVVMFPAMLAVMFLRLDEYTHAHAH
jgi:flagellar biosynthetic protein FliP